MTPFYFTEISSPLGILSLRGTDAGLTGIFMEDHRHGPANQERAGWQRDAGRFVEAAEQLAEYFAGRRRTFDVPLDRETPGSTEFQRRVWTALDQVRYGETISYGELARRIGQPAAVRAVGLANGKNPLSIIVPCHRVIGASGQLTGYGGGTARKRWLLDLEQGALAL